MFGRDEVKLLVACAARALEREDRHLAECFRTRGWKGKEIGICDNQNEHYYQYLIWSELMCSFPWRTRTERNRRDLTFFDNDTDKPVAYAEIKLWFNYQGIKRDVEKLGKTPKPGVMLILTPQLTKQVKGNLDEIAGKLGVNLGDLETASFAILTRDGGNWVFSVIGFLVPLAPI